MKKGIFVIEIGTEELPYKQLKVISNELYINFIRELDEFSFIYKKINNYYSSRRISLKIYNLKFKKNINKTYLLNNLKIFNKYIVKINQNNYNINVKNNSNQLIKYKKYIKKILAILVNKILHKMQKKTYMRWGNTNNRFLRPVHSLLIMLDKKIINIDIFGIKSSRSTFGHRFMGKQNIILKHADEYPEILFNKGKVIVKNKKRKEKIKNMIVNKINKINGKIKSENKLINEIASLTEWPIVLIGSFKKKYLHIPKEILIYVMRNLYKFIPIYNNNNILVPYFIFIINIEIKKYKKIIKEHEIVLCNRFKDIEFLINQDYKNSLEFYYLSLNNILFHEKLGTMLEKTKRIKNISLKIAKIINVDITNIKRAAMLSKCDLLTRMVFEFPDMQGIIGMYHALKDNENKNIALSLKEQYYPSLFVKKIPSNHISLLLAIADKIDNLVGMIGINIYPKGGNDPFGLRRSAISIIKIILHNKLLIDVKKIIEENKLLFNHNLFNLNVTNDVFNFLLKRMINLYNKEGHNKNYINAIFYKNDKFFIDIDKKISVISYFYKSNILNKLILTSKRIFKFLLKSNEKINKKINKKNLQNEYEILLVNNLYISKKKIEKLLQKKDYKSIIIELSSLNYIVENYLKNTMINDPIKIIRINRLTILKKLLKLFSCICDLSLLNIK
ncbi:Glycyl-tRNA synthetase beta chain [Candidatus Purcelliella pentastirinorum]|uniref:Glycine--tRNA ligase beta subunit n=1 Tax=Candidatus Purcelliella pentastirinorum TaxID=472834 RepID=A0A346DZ65_9ENTR|nr:glycine--tRNA ligase subunit beta [Candidatus Purcelliella pentastirinorum]AXN02020.1 Glycyl-tRNA synthetase beta chain [Candidatus Purcelliella pentastirinorum]